MVAHHLFKVLLLLLDPFQSFSSLFGSRRLEAGHASALVRVASVSTEWVQVIVANGVWLIH